jgi:hypothetical protein
VIAADRSAIVIDRSAALRAHGCAIVPLSAVRDARTALL